MRIGYARVSTQDQRLDVQHEALTRSGCEKTFDDTMSGKVSDRPGLQKALRFKAGEATGVVIGAMLQLTDEAGEAYLDAHRALDVSRTST